MKQKELIKRNIMRTKTIISILLAILSLTSCSDWLDVSPKTEIREKKLFSSEEGYRNALAGVYIKLGQKDLYGLQASMYIPEFLAHTWTIPTESKDPTAFYLAKNDYTNSNVETTLDELWSSYYNAIVQVNDILNNIENTNVHFSGSQKEIITGELYGLRAFLHLDLLRLFGPVPDVSAGSKPAIPYVTSVTTDVKRLQTTSFDKVKQSILSDLDQAESLLKDTDPYIRTIDAGDSNSDSGNTDLKENEIYRQLHLNYWAVIALKARLFYWTGEKQRAVEQAEKVINATDSNGRKVFTLADEEYYANNSNANLNMKQEHVFGAYNSKFADEVVKEYYSAADALFTQKEEYITSAYESNLYPDDIRNKGTRYWSKSQDSGSSTVSFHFNKYFGFGSYYGYQTVPIIRLSEMYFIVFEDASLTEMKPYWQTWRLSRGLDSSIDATLTTESSVLKRMEKEWRKEFMGEGQMFYFYKKHNYGAYSWPTSYKVPTDAYILPKPKSQTMYE